MPLEINNYGNGDCGPLAFSIGLIAIIQDEVQKTKSSPTFQRWTDLGLTEVSLHNILDCDLNRLHKNPSSYNRELLNKLQHSIRVIIAQKNKDDLIFAAKEELFLKADRLSKIEGTLIGNKLFELINYYSHNIQETNLNKLSYEIKKISQFNELAHSQEILLLANQLAIDTQNMKPDLKNNYIKAKIFEDIIIKTEDLETIESNPDSIILKGIDIIAQRQYWTTHDLLYYGAGVLNVNLIVNNQINGVGDSNKPNIILKNDNSVHWTTLIPNHKSQYNEKVINTQKKNPELVQALLKNKKLLGLFSKIENPINLDDINSARALPNESDEQFAIRLQEAEFRLAKIEY